MPGLLGARLTFHRPPAREWLTDGTADWVWAEAERVGLPLMVFGPGLTEVFASVAGSHPGLKIVIDHLNLSTAVKTNDLEPFLRPVFALSEFSNVAVKASALPCYVDEGYPFPSLQRPVRQVIDAFGADRVLWGSDLSRCTLPVPGLGSILHRSTRYLVTRRGRPGAGWCGVPLARLAG